MRYLFNYGLSQEDALTENRLLKFVRGDELLCIASAGEVPLNLLALNDINITAVDTDINQLFLSKLKLQAAIHLNNEEAAGFLGYIRMKSTHRYSLYAELRKWLPSEEQVFWDTNQTVIRRGVIHFGRFEQYIARYRPIVMALIGSKKLKHLLAFASVEEQKNFFDGEINTGLLKNLFKIIFHPQIYKNRGISEQGLSNQGAVNMADFFYSRLRNFCVSTSARLNYYFQYTFWGEVRFLEALPEYLQPRAREKLTEREEQVRFYNESITERLNKSATGHFNKIHLSNIGDWMSRADYDGLLELIHQKANRSSIISARYIHQPIVLPSKLRQNFLIDQQEAGKATVTDRYPFYSLVPIYYKRY